jgi:cystathionine beta-lyase/cystathionine gamma-synthase
MNDATMIKNAVDPVERARLIVAHDDVQAYDAVVPPIVQTSLFTFSSCAEMAATYRGERQRWVYSRTTNPTVRVFEEKLAALELADDAIGFASGMAAISAAVMAFVEPGDRIVCVRHVYPDAYRLFETLLKRWQVSTTYVDGADPEAVEAALPGACILYLESPTSWTMETHDLPRLAALAKAHRAVSIIDNSWSTPVFQQPHSLGVDLVLHSASKYIGGHSDTVAGVVAGRGDLIDTIRRTISPYVGGKLAPFDAWLLLRGLRTLPARLKAHEQAASTIARRLAAHSKVERIYHPAVVGPLPAGLHGTSGLFSFTFRDGVDIARFCDSLQLFKLGVSWGGHESLVVPALVTRGQAAGPNSAIDFGVPERMVRLHVGLEGTEALWADIVQAIDAATTT